MTNEQAKLLDNMIRHAGSHSIFPLTYLQEIWIRLGGTCDRSWFLDGKHNPFFVRSSSRDEIGAKYGDIMLDGDYSNLVVMFEFYDSLVAVWGMDWEERSIEAPGKRVAAYHQRAIGVIGS